MPNKIIFLFLSTLLSLLTGCSSISIKNRDPLEPMNRVIYKFNDKADYYVMQPVAQGYHDYTPGFVRSRVKNFFSNLDDAGSAVNYSLQGSPRPALYCLSRFVLNSTVGVFGLFDLTNDNEPRYRQTDFGETFATWGWKNSSYLVIPLKGPSTLRDGSGSLAGYVLQQDVLFNNPKPAVSNSTSAISAINTREQLLGVEDTINGAALDPYIYTRDAWLQIRAKRTGDDIPHENHYEDINIDDLMN